MSLVSDTWVNLVHRIRYNTPLVESPDGNLKNLQGNSAGAALVEVSGAALPAGAATAALQPVKTDVGPTLVIDNTALPAAGAFTTTDYQTITPGTRRVTFIVKYTKHASATTGQCKKRMLWKFSATCTDVYEGFVDTGNLTVSEPKVALKGYCEDINGPQFNAGVTSGQHHWTYEVPPGAIGCIMQLAEMGDTANKGTVSQWIATSEVL